MQGTTQNLDPIGSAVFTFIGYNGKGRQIYIDKPSIYRFKYIKLLGPIYFSCEHFLVVYIVKQK